MVIVIIHDFCTLASRPGAPTKRNLESVPNLCLIQAVEEHEAGIVGMSALLPTTMPNMGKTIEAFIDEDLRDDVKFMVGGAPVTPEFADDMGADAYGANAVECVEVAKQLAGVTS